MLYEDLISLWLAFVIYEFVPSAQNFSFLSLIFLLLLKEFLFLIVLIFLRIKLIRKSLEFNIIFEKIFLIIIFSLYILDLTLFSLKFYFKKFYFSSLLAILWFLHYFFIIKIFFLRFSYNYLKILLGIIFPVFMLIGLEEIFDILGLSFKGDTFFFLFFVLFFSPYFMVKIWPLKSLNNKELEELIYNFLKKNRMKIGEIYVLKDLGKKFYTAGIVGFLPPFRYLFFSQPLLDILSWEEVLGVVAHEVGHLKNRHNLWLLLILFNLPIFLLTILLLIFFIGRQVYPDFYLIFKKFSTEKDIFFALFLIFFSYIYLRYIFAFFLRQCEREADLYSFYTLNSPEPIISALFKIGKITGQLYKKSWHHYGIAERIDFLNQVSFNKKEFLKIKKRLKGIKILLIFWIIFNSTCIFLALYTEDLFKTLIEIFLEKF